VMLLSRVKFPQWSSFCLFRGVDEWIPVEWSGWTDVARECSRPGPVLLFCPTKISSIAGHGEDCDR
jgi:hypothetical protein